MKRTKLLLAVAILAAVPVARAGNLTPPAAPTNPASAQFTLGDIYNRLNSGTNAPKRLGVFTEPVAGPGTATMFTTDQIMGLAPFGDNTNGAAGLDVVIGKTFWSLRNIGGTWGLQTGTRAPAQPGRTGQTQCFNAANSVTACPGTPAGQDGALQKGVAWPIPRFTSNPNGTVTDNLTGLIWLANANCYGLVDWTTAMTNASALTSGACGLTDSSTAGQWRVPNVKELASLIDFAVFNPALLPGNPFTNVQNSVYWSSTTVVNFPGSAWGVDLYGGNIGYYDKPLPFTHYLWPVRGGQ